MALSPQRVQLIGSKSYMDTFPLQALRILVVDDNQDSREMMIAALEAEGAEVIAAESAQAALITLSTWKPNLLISDIRMPDADGYSFLKALRSRSITIPAIAVTAFAREDDRQEALAAGYQSHLSKPIDLELLYSTIATLIRESGAQCRIRDQKE
ncbi:response regulator [Leptolyngbya sp. FACHB-17]|uniref:response regulator n=1 Tax=unclassified Leptolyngbya TaxID=2650499 RepID=UPI0016818112|nr:response regulator [Leptolyngbya sp. FACHB-17]MBD2081251.1 response regulator [Leptolyngbya sp. FACHB-17]